MKKLTILLTAVLLCTACQESLEERCERESKDYTKKHCPLRIDQYTVMDSMVFDKASHTISYVYTLQGDADDAAAISKTNPRELLIGQVKNTAQLKLYKEAGYSFRYVYYSAKTKGIKLFDTTVHEKDYQ